MEFNMNEKLKAMREVSLIEEIKSNSLQIEQLSEDVRGLMYAIRDLTEQLTLKNSLVRTLKKEIA